MVGNPRAGRGILSLLTRLGHRVDMVVVHKPEVLSFFIAKLNKQGPGPS